MCRITILSLGSQKILVNLKLRAVFFLWSFPFQTDILMPLSLIDIFKYIVLIYLMKGEFLVKQCKGKSITPIGSIHGLMMIISFHINIAAYSKWFAYNTCLVKHTG